LIYLPLRVFFIISTYSGTNKSFYFLLAILFVLPIPLGANRPWAWSFFEMAIFALTACVVVKNWKVDRLGINAYLNSVYLWMMFILVALLQIVPLPDFVVALLSPTSFDLFYSVSADWYFLSVDPNQSMVSFTKLLSFFCLFICVLLLVNTEQRIRMLLLTIVAAGTFQALYGVFELVLGSSTSLVFGFPVSEAATGSFVYQNHYANFLMLSLAAGVGLTVTSLEKSDITSQSEHAQSFASTLLNSNALVRSCIVIMIIGLAMSRSGMGNTAFFLSIAAVGAIAFVLLKNKAKA